mgnify:CR=1 FL=1
MAQAIQWQTICVFTGCDVGQQFWRGNRFGYRVFGFVCCNDMFVAFGAGIFVAEQAMKFWRFAAIIKRYLKVDVLSSKKPEWSAVARVFDDFD